MVGTIVSIAITVFQDYRDPRFYVAPRYSHFMPFVAASSCVLSAHRDVVREGFPLHTCTISKLLKHIGAHEQDIMDTVLYSIRNHK